MVLTVPPDNVVVMARQAWTASPVSMDATARMASTGRPVGLVLTV
jgi:hypothetical protein